MKNLFYTFAILITVLLISQTTFAGNALSFSNSQDSYCHTGEILSIQINTLTLECWLRLTGDPSVTQLIVYNGNSGFDGYGICLEGSYLSILLGGAYEQVSSVQLQSNTWTHLALVADASDNWTLYANGAPATTLAFDPYQPDAVADFSVGGQQFGSDSFNGVIDEVRFSSIARYTSTFTPPSAPFTTDVNTIALYHFDEGTGSTTADASGNGNTLTLVSSPTWVADNFPLPVELTSFTASVSNLTTILTWKTATEVNNAGFDIERQPASTQQWTKVGSVAGAGTSNAPHNYSYTDNVGSAGTYSYRLKQIDHDGAFIYLQEVQVTIEVPKVLALNQNYPNPFNPSTVIQFSVPADGRAMLKVYNTLGQQVATLFDGVATAGEYHQATFDGSRFASGIYFARLQFGGQTLVKKLLLTK